MLRSSYDACGCSTQTTSTINLKRSTLHPHEGQADRPNTPSDSVNPGSNPGPPANEINELSDRVTYKKPARHLTATARAMRNMAAVSAESSVLSEFTARSCLFWAVRSTRS